MVRTVFIYFHDSKGLVSGILLEEDVHHLELIVSLPSTGDKWGIDEGARRVLLGSRGRTSVGVPQFHNSMESYRFGRLLELEYLRFISCGCDAAGIGRQ